ncbi:MAG: hypothetical protein OXG84_19025 [Chloroflexi bacterium]|nr:hypothetical protein [Chloroflexota bacterium]
MQKWIFEPAKLLLDTGNESVDFAVLGILNAVPEMLAKCQGHEQTFQQGLAQWNANRQSAKSTSNPQLQKQKKPQLSSYLYRKGIEFVFPDHDDNIFDEDELMDDLLYGKLRCGLAHFAFVGERILLTRGQGNLCSILIDAVNMGHMPGWTYFPPSSCLLSVDVLVWYEQMEKRISDYICDLRDSTNTNMRSAFSERITRSDVPSKYMPTDCMCSSKRLCERCADLKFPATHV